MKSKYRDWTPEEIKWIKSFERVMKKAPEIFMFVGSGSIYLYPERVLNEFGGVDNENTNVVIETPMECDGGDW